MEKHAARCIIALFALLAILPYSSLRAEQAALADSDATTGSVGHRSHEQWTEEWDPVVRRWVRVDQAYAVPREQEWRGDRGPAARTPLAKFGPFVVTSATVAAVVDSTDSRSPEDFARMITAFPQLRVLSFVDAPGTVNDIANLKVGRMIRASGITTHMPSGGSARSGAVELFLAGSHRTMEPGALFAVHSWRDSYGREPQDFAENDPANRLYIDYYIDMGMSETDARGFYAMTNSVPHESALWFGPDQMRRWIASDEATSPAPAWPPVTIAYRFDYMFDARFALGG